MTNEIRALIDRLETYYQFEDLGGPLKLCVEWQELKALLVSVEGEQQRIDRDRLHTLITEAKARVDPDEVARLADQVEKAFARPDREE